MRATVAVLALLALAACGQSTSSTSTTSASTSAGGGAFPTIGGVAHRLEATLTDPNSGRSTQLVQMRDGAKMRTEIQGSSNVVSIMNFETHDAYALTNQGGRHIAMKLSLDPANLPGGVDWNGHVEGVTPTQVGPCSAAGENGTEWTSTHDGHTGSTCVTSDGILLRVKRDDQTLMEATRVQRGPQDAALFEVPAGYQVMDLGAMGAAMQDALAKAKQKSGN